MINTGGTSVEQHEIGKCVVYVNDDFSISGFGATKIIDGMDMDMGIGKGKGLYISINDPDEGENTEEVDFQKASDANYNVSAPKKGAPAQMFIIFDNHWAWPVERTHISLSYPDFKTWANDHSTDWTGTRGEGAVVNRNY